MAVTNWQLQKLPHLLWIEAFHLVWNCGIKGGSLLMVYLYCRIILVSFPRYCLHGYEATKLNGMCDVQQWYTSRDNSLLCVICDGICGGELGTRLDEPYSTNIRICCLPSYFPNCFLHSQSLCPGNQTSLTM